MSGDITPGSAWRHPSPFVIRGEQVGVLHELIHSVVHQNPREILNVWIMHIFLMRNANFPPCWLYQQLSRVVAKKVVKSWRAKTAPCSHAGMSHGCATPPSSAEG